MDIDVERGDTLFMMNFQKRHIETLADALFAAYMVNMAEAKTDEQRKAIARAHRTTVNLVILRLELPEHLAAIMLKI